MIHKICMSVQILNGGAPCQQIDSEEDDDQEAEAEDEVRHCIANSNEYLKLVAPATLSRANPLLPPCCNPLLPPCHDPLLPPCCNLLLPLCCYPQAVTSATFMLQPPASPRLQPLLPPCCNPRYPHAATSATSMGVVCFAAWDSGGCSTALDSGRYRCAPMFDCSTLFQDGVISVQRHAELEQATAVCAVLCRMLLAGICCSFYLSQANLLSAPSLHADL